jgi:hypothetical protein
MNKDDQVLTDHQRQTLKKSLDRMDDEMGINSYDVKKQNQILSGRLDQMSYLYKNKEKKQQAGVLGGIFGGGNTLVAPGIALALTFTLGIMASQFYSAHYGNQSSSQSVDVLRSETSADGKPAMQVVTTVNPAEERSKYLEAALRAGLKIQANQVDGKPSMQVFGLEASNPKHLEFKAITGLPPNQAGSVIFTFAK